jgi:NitT/TauT family transport system ATP-binding protein
MTTTSFGEVPLADAMVVYEGVSKFFAVRSGSGGKHGAELMVALDRVSASVRKGELVTLLGPSGCGKTTLLRLTAGLIAADEGRITIEEKEVTGPRKDACMVFQNFGLLPWRTVMGNVEFPLEIDGLPIAERREQARHFLELVGLAAFAEHYPHELSGGMQQRVSLARALVFQPQILLMDEPFAALDEITREVMQDELLRLWARIDTTVVFITHSIPEAVLLSEKILVLSARPGRVIETIDVPFERPRTESIRGLPRFAEITQHIRHHLRAGRADIERLDQC